MTLRELAVTYRQTEDVPPDDLVDADDLSSDDFGAPALAFEDVYRDNFEFVAPLICSLSSSRLVMISTLKGSACWFR